jgi:hypothetical protein
MASRHFDNILAWGQLLIFVSVSDHALHHERRVIYTLE